MKGREGEDPEHPRWCWEVKDKGCGWGVEKLSLGFRRACSLGDTMTAGERKRCKTRQSPLLDTYGGICIDLGEVENGARKRL